MPQKIFKLVLFLSILAGLSLLLGGRTTFAQDNTPPPPKQYPLKSETLPLSSEFHTTTLDTSASDTVLYIPPKQQEWTGLIFGAYMLDTHNWDILYAIHLKSSTFSNQTNNPARDIHPQLNRDATKFVFVSDRDGNDEIYLKDMETNGLQRLTVNAGQDSDPTWSPDDSQVAFTSDRDGDDEIFVMNADGSDVRQLTHNGIADFSPTWSPDGSQLAWVQIWDSQSGVIYIMNADGSNPHPISNPLRYLNHLSWSPDGSMFYFDYDSNVDGWQDLGVINVDGSDLRTISFGRNTIDLLASGWYPYPSETSNIYTKVVASSVKYVLDNGTWYIESMSAQLRSIYWGGDVEDFFASNVKYPLFPHLRSRDPFLPVSSATPLSKYSRIPFVPFSIYAYDIGKSGLVSVYSRYSLGTSGNWVSLSPVSVSTDPAIVNVSVFQDTAGQALFLCSSARDQVGNQEAWPEPCNSSTILYQTLLDGAVRDIRDIPVSPTSAEISPASVHVDSGDGWYRAYLPDSDTYTVTIDAQGYLSTSMSVIAQVDVQRTAIVHPADNLIQGGDFETTTLHSPWVVSGTAAISTEIAYSGSGSLHLGSTCKGSGCIRQSAPVAIPNFTSDDLTYAFDSAQNLHMMDHSGGYFMRTPDGQWSYTKLWNEYTYYPSPIAAGPDGTIYTLHATYPQAVLFVHPLGSSEWLTETLPTGFTTGYYSLTTDEVTGDLYVTYGVRLLRRDNQGTWSDWGSLYGNVLSIARANNGIVYAVTQRSLTYYNDVIYIWKVVDGTYNEIARYTLPDNMSLFSLSLQAHMNQDGKVFILYNNDIYLTWSADSGWSDALKIDALNSPISGEYAKMVRLNDGRVALMRNIIDYYTKASLDVFFSIPGKTSLRHWHDGNICDGCVSAIPIVFPDGSIHAVASQSSGVGPSYELTAHPALTSTEQTRVSQAVTISAEKSNPTLSFMYALQSFSPSQNSAFQVAVTDAGGQHTLISTNTTTEGAWQHAWVDMSPWAGQSITVTFALSQPVGDRAMNLYLDDIYLGAWTTPVISDVSPLQLDTWDGATIVITGTNFITPTVQLGNYTLTIIRVTPDQITVQLPAGIPAGAYILRVQNAYGQVAIYKKNVILGHVIYLPIIQR